MAATIWWSLAFSFLSVLVFGQEDGIQCFNPVTNVFNQVNTINETLAQQCEQCSKLHEMRDQLGSILTLLTPSRRHHSGGALSARSKPQDCGDVQRSGVNASGVYTLYPDDGGQPVDVFCDMETDGGGWTVFQRRIDGSVNFYRGWKNYKHGFGFLDGEHWLGNEKIHRLTNQKDYALRVDLVDWEGASAYAHYDRFSVDQEEMNYTLNLETYNGTASSSMNWNNGKPFSTKDMDNDGADANCAAGGHGAWWYGNTYWCHDSNLNGRFYDRASSGDAHKDGIVWYYWKRNFNPLKETVMMFRPTES